MFSLCFIWLSVEEKKFLFDPKFSSDVSITVLRAPFTAPLMLAFFFANKSFFFSIFGRASSYCKTATFASEVGFLVKRSAIALITFVLVSYTYSLAAYSF
jgi:uncharacterized membrane protein